MFEGRFSHPGGGSTVSVAGGGDAIADNEVLRGNGTTGVQGSVVTLSDTGGLQNVSAIDSGSFTNMSISASGQVNIIGPSATVIVGSNFVDLGWYRGTGFFRQGSNQTVTNSTTLTDATNLVISVASGRSYTIRAELFFTTVNTSGVKVAISGTATHSNILYDVHIMGVSTPGILTAGRATAKDTAVGVTASGTACYAFVTGCTTTSSTGSITIQFAQNAETGAAESAILLRGSYIELMDIA